LAERLLLLLMALQLTACASGVAVAPYHTAGYAALPFSPADVGIGKIKHVVIIIQENRSFDNLFQGYPGADTVARGKDSHGEIVTLKPVSLAKQYIIDHSVAAMIAACDGTGALPGTDCRNDGFDREQSYCFDKVCPPNPPEYVYVPHSDSAPYFAMAHEWVLADHNFQSHLDESFIGHQYLIAAQANSAANLPTGAWGCEDSTSRVATVTHKRKIIPLAQSACFDYKTLADELNDAKLTWRFFTSGYDAPSSGEGSVWSAYQAIRHIYQSPQWKRNVIVPQTRFFTKIHEGRLANVTWITPICANSDHVNCGGGHGPSWVTALVNAIGRSRFWNSTAIFVVWDDWGGLYDHVPPPYKNYDGLGFRVPLLVISPYAKKNYVSHVQYESAGILTFTEDVFGLGRLAAADKRATSPAADCFDFSQAPRPFVPIEAREDAEFFMHQPVDRRIPDYE
jgi:phospholipase C